MGAVDSVTFENVDPLAALLMFLFTSRRGPARQYHYRRSMCGSCISAMMRDIARSSVATWVERIVDGECWQFDAFAHGIKARDIGGRIKTPDGSRGRAS